MKKLLLFILVFLSLGANAQLVQLGGSGGGLDGGSGGGGGGGGGGAGSIATWAPATAYALDDIAIFNDTIFIRIIAGTTATAPDADVTNWTPVGLNSLPQHVAATYYHVGQVVEYNGLLYRRLIAGISAGTPDGDAVNWQPQQIELSSQVTGILGQANGGTGFDFSSLANGEIFIGNGTGFVSASLTGTLNQVDVTNGAGSITLSTPQDIHSGASPTFVSASFTGVAANEFLKTDGASGLTSVGSIDLTADVGTSVLPIANGGTNSSTALNDDRIMLSSSGAIVEGPALLDGELLIGQSGGAPVSGSITGTVNQVAVANGAGTIGLSLPQDIHSGASPTFVSATFSGALANEFLKTDGASGLTTVASIDLTSDVSTSILPIANGGTNSSTALNNDRMLLTSGGSIVEGSALLDGEFFIGASGGAPAVGTIGGTVNQVDVAYSSNSITASLPQDIHTGATPTFASASLGNIDVGSNYVSASNVGGGIDLNPSAPGVVTVNGDLVVTGSLSGTVGGFAADSALRTNGTGDIDPVTLTDGQFIIGATGGAPDAGTIAGTANQVNMVYTSNSITASLPQDIHAGATPSFAGVNLTGLTTGSVIFAGAGGSISQDNANLFYNDGTNRLGLSTATPTAHVDIDGVVDEIQLKVQSNNVQSDNIFEVTASNGNTEHFVVDEGGNTGVKTANPATTFHVTGGGQFDFGASETLFLDNASNPHTGTLGAVDHDFEAGVLGATGYFMSMDSGGFDDVHGIRVDSNLSGESNPISPSNILLSADVSSMTNVTQRYINVQKVGVEGANSTIQALHVNQGIDPIHQESSSIQDSDISFTDDGGFTDVTADFSSGASNIQIFSNDNAYIYVSHDNQFSTIEVLLTIVANQNINGIFEYSQGGASWNTLSVTDGTNGFQQSGSINFSAPTDWAQDSVNASANKYWVRIQRTRNGLPTPPTESTIKVLPNVDYMWDKDGDLTVRTISASQGVVLPNLTTAERNALTPSSGQQIFNTDINQAEYYNGTAWISY